MQEEGIWNIYRDDTASHVSSNCTKRAAAVGYDPQERRNLAYYENRRPAHGKQIHIHFHKVDLVNKTNMVFE